MEREHDKSELEAAIADAERYVDQASTFDSDYGPVEGAPRLAPWPSEPVRIVFLDFDGVLNSTRSVGAIGTRYRFDPAAIQLVNRLCVESSAHVVVTSTWREHWSLEEIVGFLERDGFQKKSVVGKTPVLDKARGSEIDSWLRNSPYKVSTFVIIDDHDDMEMHLPRLVQTNSAIGFQRQDLTRATKLLLDDR